MLRKVKSIHCNCAANNLYDKNILHAYVDVSCSEIMWTLLTVAYKCTMAICKLVSNSS